MMPPALLACAPNVAPATLEAVVRVESRGNPLALHVNGLPTQPLPARDAVAAARMAKAYIAHGDSVDIGLMQVNSRNLAVLGITVEQALDPCTNIRAGGLILTADYAEAAHARGDGQGALQAALSAYNTGSFERGFANGYVARYYGPGSVPALAGGGTRAVATAAATLPRGAPRQPANPYTADSAVYARGAIHVRID